MTIWLKQSTAAEVVLGPFVDATDGVTAETGLTISQADIRLKKNDGAFAQTNNATGATHLENGYYEVPLDTTDTGTLGRLRVAVNEAGALPVWQDFMVVPANVWDSLFGADLLQVDVAQLGGDAQSATDIKDFADAGYDPSTNKVEGVKLADTVTTYTGNTPQTGDAFARLGVPAGASVSADIAAIEAQTDDIGAAGAGLTAADDAILAAIAALNNLSAAQVNAEVDTALADIHLDHLLATAYDPASKPGAADALLNELIESDGGVSRFTANALEQAPSGGAAGADIPVILPPYLRKYGTLQVTGTTAIRFALQKAGGDLALSADWTPAAGDVKLSIDGAAEANVTNLPTFNDGAWELILTAAETTGKNLTIKIQDAATKAIADAFFSVETFGHASAMYPDDMSAAGASAAAIADAVLDEALSGHTTPGTLGKAVADIETDATAILADTAVIGAAGAGLSSIPWNAAWDAEVQSEVTDALNAYDPPTNAELVSEVNAVQADIAALNDLSAAQVNAEVDAALADIHLDHLLATDYDPASKPGVATALLNEIVESDAGVSRFTANALEQGPAGGGGGPSAAEIADAVWDESIAGHLTGGSTGASLNGAGSAGDPWTTTLPGAYGAGTAGKIVGDNLNATVSSRASQASLDTVDTVADAIKAKTDNLPTDPADQSAVEAAITAATSPLATAANLATVAGYLDTEVAAILAAVDTEIAALPNATRDAVLAAVIEGAVTLKQSLQLSNAAAAGKLSGAATTSVALRNLADTLDRIAATVDADGNRTAVTRTFE